MNLDFLFFVAVIMALVEYIKKLGLTGWKLTIASMVLGLFFGIGYQFSQEPPVTFSQWFSTVIWGLATGLTASGLFDVGASWAKKSNPSSDRVG